jgi:hypothetical protein
MTRQRLFYGLMLAATSLGAVQRSFADPPDQITPYRFVPRQSTLIVSPGTEAPARELTVYGTFDLLSEWTYTHDPLAIHHTYAFTDVRAFAGNPLSATAVAPLDLDKVLNLSGLTGTLLPVASPFDVIKFEGKTADGSAVNVFASVLGKWLYLRGGTTPPAATGTSYQLKALARTRPFADLNDDAVVDGADLAMWMSHFAPPASAAGDPLVPGDANGDGIADGADFLVWQQQLGETAPAIDSLEASLQTALATIPSSARAAAAVPEPAALALAYAALMLLAASRRFAIA